MHGMRQYHSVKVGSDQCAQACAHQVPASGHPPRCVLPLIPATKAAIQGNKELYGMHQLIIRTCKKRQTSQRCEDKCAKKAKTTRHVKI